MASGIRTGNPRGFNEGRSSKFREGSRVRQTPEEGWRIYRPKRCGNNNNNKDEDNSPKTLNDKNNYGTFPFLANCQRLFSGTSTKTFPFLMFLTDFGFALLIFTFSIRKGNNLFTAVSSIDSMTIYCGNSLTSLSKWAPLVV